MSDLNPEDLFEAIDRLLAGLLERAGVTQPPVDAVSVAGDHLGIPIEIVEPELDEQGRPKQARRRESASIALTEGMTLEQQNAVAANGVARSLLPEVLRKLEIPGGAESKNAVNHIRGLVVPRLLVPTKLLRAELRHCGYDVLELQRRFVTASVEVVAQRLLDLDEPCAITMADDGIVAFRKANRFAINRRLLPAEQECLDRVMQSDGPERVRSETWTIMGWPVPDRPFRRVVMRSVPDEV